MAELDVDIARQGVGIDMVYGRDLVELANYMAKGDFDGVNWGKKANVLMHTRVLMDTVLRDERGNYFKNKEEWEAEKATILGGEEGDLGREECRICRKPFSSLKKVV